MREIKFRVWDNKLNTYKDMDNSKNGIEYCCGELTVSSGWDSYRAPTYERDDLIGRYDVEQFTGLKDKNGVDVYEGDLVRIRTWNYDAEQVFVAKVYFTLGMFVVDDSCGNKEMFLAEFTFKNLSYENSVEVIGNIHQNKELLEEN